MRSEAVEAGIQFACEPYKYARVRVHGSVWTRVGSDKTKLYSGKCALSPHTLRNWDPRPEDRRHMDILNFGLSTVGVRPEALDVEGRQLMFPGMNLSLRRKGPVLHLFQSLQTTKGEIVDGARLHSGKTNIDFIVHTGPVLRFDGTSWKLQPVVPFSLQDRRTGGIQNPSWVVVEMAHRLGAIHPPLLKGEGLERFVQSTLSGFSSR